MEKKQINKEKMKKAKTRYKRLISEIKPYIKTPQKELTQSEGKWIDYNSSLFNSDNNSLFAN
jgi:hypothetical protein